MSDFSQRLAALPPEKRALLAMRLRQKEQAKTNARPPIVPVPRIDGTCPLSFTQERLWFLDQFSPGSAMYNVPTALRYTGPLNYDALLTALNVIIQRHEALRTTFVSVDGQPVQRINPPQPVAMPIVDLSGLADAEREAEAQRLAYEEAQQPFDLSSDLMLRVRLLRLSATEHIHLITMHHIASDGWSSGVFVRELAALYAAFSAGQTLTLPPLPIQYGDFAAWQRQWLQGETLERQRNYWTNQLEGAPALLELPTDRPRPPVQTYNGTTQSIQISPALTAELHALSRKEGATLFMSLLTAFQILLYRYTGQPDILVGSPIAGRDQVETQELIGFFVNMLVLRTQLDGQPSVRELLSRVRKTALDAYAHQDIPFEMLVEHLQPERSLSYMPLFQVAFALQNAPMQPLKLTDIMVHPPADRSGIAKYDLFLELTEVDQGLSAVIEYNTDLFDADTIRRMLDHYQKLLAAMVANPHASVDALPLLPAAEHERLLEEFNRTAAPLPLDRLAHEVFEEQAAQRPQAIAALFRDEQITYAELNRRANQFAHWCGAQGIGRGDCVGVFGERGIELLITMLGCLKLGATYVPLDPAYPDARLTTIIAAADIRLIATQATLAIRSQDLAQTLTKPALVCCWDDAPEGVALPDRQVLSLQPGENVAVEVGPRDLANIFFTSGSTGTPKGVMVEQIGMLNHLWAKIQVLELTAESIVVQNASHCFDISVWQFLAALLVGGRVVIYDNDTALSPIGLLHAVERDQVTVLETVPTMLEAMLQAVDEQDPAARVSLPSLAYLISNAETLPVPLCRRWLNTFPHVPLLNTYGATECSDDTTHAIIRTPPADTVARVPVGTPIPGFKIYVLDAHLQPVPIGCPGQIAMAGIGVGRGYLGDIEKTARVFVPNPFLEPTGSRLYLTGDLGRWNAAGQLEFLGRMDGQVKVRGHRIELGEVEAALARYPGVRQAVVMARLDHRNQLGLVGYIVPAAADDESAAQSSYVDDWHLLYDEMYSGGQADDPTFHIVGWHSSYTGAPFPPAEMREWRDATVERIRALRPQRILEIGCGSGLLLFPLAGECARYHGIDFSAPALAHIRRHLPAAWTHVSLAQQRADQVTDLQPGSFDTVILNSVAQYFPSVEYLVEVISRAITLLAPGGHLFIGDVRSRSLLDAFATAITLAQAAPDMSRAALWTEVRHQVVQERELLLDPAFFTALRQAQPRISAVQVEIKRGHAHNELTQFRYDVTLTVDGPALPAAAHDVYDWAAQPWTLDDLRSTLQAAQADSVLVQGIPSARVQPLTQAATWLQDASGPMTAGEMRAEIDRLVEAAVEPEAIWALGNELGYQVRLGWSTSGATGGFDAVFSRTAAWLPEPALETEQPWSAYATAPAVKQVTAEITPRLRQYLQSCLPEYMIPSAFVALDALPLTRNGKVDRKALPAPAWTDTTATADTLPRTPVETMLAEIWQQVLGLPAVGVHANFFELGGHSLLATQVTSRIRAVFNLDLPVRALFETPTVAELAVTLETMLTGMSPLNMPPLQPVERNGVLRTSYAQQRLWFLDQLEPGSPVYNMPTALRLKGSLDIPALEHGLSEIVKRHEVLRTTFTTVDGQPTQVIHAAHPLTIPMMDISAWSGDAQTAEAYRLLTAAVEQPFNLQQGPLMRTLLLRCGPAEHILLVVVHHSVTDGWSSGIMLNELAALYTAFEAGKPSALTPLPIQYADFAVWQREWLQGEALERQLGYWKEQLRGASTVLELPTDRPRPPVQTFRGATKTFRLSPELAAELHALSRKEGVTLFMTLLAAFEVLLYRYSGQNDLLIGTPIANRTRRELEGLIGFFVNTLVLRTQLAPDLSVRELLQRVRETSLSAYAHQDLPFEMLVEHVQPTRSLSHTPLFQVMFVLNNTPQQPAQFGEIEVSPLADGDGASRFDLTLSMTEEHGQGITAALEYNTDLFNADTIARMLGHYETIVAAMAANPAQPVKTVPMLREPELHQLLAEFNDTARPYPADRCIHQLFEEQVARRPHAIAVSSGQETLSYAALNERANQLARFLRTQGVGPDVPVALCVDRTLDLVVCLIGIFKAGGAYLPLDPTYPADRLQFMLDDAQVPLLLTQQALLSLLPKTDSKVISIDGDWPTIAQQSTDNLEPTSGPSHLAYMIYTSGSTGRPKGVQLQQGPLINELVNMAEDLTITEQDVLLAITSLSFDISAIDMFLPLVCGARIELVSRSVAADGRKLADLLVSSGATVMQGTPASWRLLVQGGWPAVPSLRIAITGGEALTRDLAELLLPRVQTLWNYYGPTETTIWSAFIQIRTPEEAVLIGRPFANTSLYVLDRELQPVPIGVHGELYIGGAGPARGYLNRPELTADRFIPNPFLTAMPEADPKPYGPSSLRLYKTGDLVRYRPDGNIEYIGRRDHQVKIRGFRIELGEIEAVLVKHPAVRTAVVIAREDVPGDRRLVAYVVPDSATSTEELSATALRQFLQNHVPGYMLPSAVVLLDVLPLTPNGKLDRAALPAPDMNRDEAVVVAPRTPTEAQLASIWQELLGIEKLGVNDNFFELGGHSILATQLMTRINDAFAVEIPLRQLFEQPTIAGLAGIIEQSADSTLPADDLEEMVDLIDLLDDLSEEEVERMLAQRNLSLSGEL
jgi:amino acid adenylation domain-containing protein